MYSLNLCSLVLKCITYFYLHLHLNDLALDLWLILRVWPHTPQAFFKNITPSRQPFCWRQHFLLNYFKTLSVGPVRVLSRDLPHSSPVGSFHVDDYKPKKMLFYFTFQVTTYGKKRTKSIVLLSHFFRLLQFERSILELTFSPRSD